MRFAHLADCHLGGWRQPSLSLLNMACFNQAIDTCIKEKVDFVLIAGDLFDSPYPSIDILKDTFQEFRKLRDAGIPVFLIAGSHDYSVSGKTFLDVLERSGFCKNISVYELKQDHILLKPTIYKNIAFYGYPGKKSGLEIDDIERAKIEDMPGFFKILLLHTTIKSAVPNPKIKSIDESRFRNIDYIALGHLHLSYAKGNTIYPGPLFPNNLPELEELQEGSFCIFNNGKIEFQKIRLKKVLLLEYKTSNTLKATDEIIDLINKQNVEDKIVILKVSGILEQGKTSDIDFYKIESYLKEKGAFTLIKNTNKLSLSGPEIQMSSINTEDIETEILTKFKETNNGKFNTLIYPLMKILQEEKIYDEKTAIFEDRLLSEATKLIGI